jgi:LAGLIDADG endonuclease
MFSNKQYDYIKFKNTLLSDIRYSEFLPKYIRPTNPINSIESILKTSYFSAWLIGFMEAESYFSIYKPSTNSSLITSFDISQTNGYILISAISKHLSLTKIRQDKINCSKLKVYNVRSIENIVKFI